jgi:hypothetical protein
MVLMSVSERILCLFQAKEQVKVVVQVGTRYSAYYSPTVQQRRLFIADRNIQAPNNIKTLVVVVGCMLLPADPWYDRLPLY